MDYTPPNPSDIESMKRHEFLSSVLVFADENMGIELVRRVDGEFITVGVDADHTYTTLADLIHEAEQNLR